LLVGYFGAGLALFEYNKKPMRERPFPSDRDSKIRRHSPVFDIHRGLSALALLAANADQDAMVAAGVSGSSWACTPVNIRLLAKNSCIMKTVFRADLDACTSVQVRNGDVEA